MKTRLLLLCAAFLCITVTTSAQMVTLSAGILKPATVTLPERVQKIYLALRNDEETLHTQSEVNAFTSLTQLKLLLESTGRYTVELAEIDPAQRSTTDEVPLSPLSWSEVGRVTKYDTTALLIVLEKYQLVQVAAGQLYEQRLWRMYDNTTQSLRDEFDHRYNNPSNTNGISPAVKIYADRIMMHWEWVQRDYYKGGNSQMKAAWHCLDSSDWEGAAVIWQLVANDSLKDAKAAGKACYNMALYCELTGDIPGAQQWLTRSKQLGNAVAPYYARTVRERTGEISLLAQQLAQNQGQIPLEEIKSTSGSQTVSRSKGTKYPEARTPPANAEELRKRSLPVSTDPR